MAEKEKKKNLKVAIIGAGVSGILACRYVAEMGFTVTVFEAHERVGGVWSHHALGTTRLQNVKETYRFSDFPWPGRVQDTHPTHTQVTEYLESYVNHFDLHRHIQFRSVVESIEYEGGESVEEMNGWHQWGGDGTAFGSQGRWTLHVTRVLGDDGDHSSSDDEVHEADFVILCLGQFSGLPYVPEFDEDHGTKVFNGTVLHAKDCAALLKSSHMTKGKRVTVVGSYKSALDIAVECANINGAEFPCRLIMRSPHWFLPSDSDKIWGLSPGLLFFNRFAELTLHKPGESLFLSLLATLLSPLRNLVSKYVESYIRWKLPLKKHGLIPSESFFDHISKCQIGVLPYNFFDRVEDGSIVVTKVTNTLEFCNKGLVVDGAKPPEQTDVVIFATGYQGDKKLKNIFKSPHFQNHMAGSSRSIVPLYRQILNPRIPRLAVVGFAESYSNMATSELRCQWLVSFMAGNVELPSIREMEKEISVWGEYINKYAGKHFRRCCISNIHIWYSDQLCKDMGCNPKRKKKKKKGLLAELFEPYDPTDYAGLLQLHHMA